MKKNYIIYSLGFLILTNFVSLTTISAQEPIAFGEINASGVVQIESSTGKWVQLKGVYPLLKNTKIKTGDGIVLITTKEGSRIDLSKETEAALNTENGNYDINLVNGTVSFNVTPSVSLTINTKDATIQVAQQVGGYYSLVAGVGAPSFSNIQGVVFSSSKGTLIRNISGKINVKGQGIQARILNTGESLFASAKGGDKPLGYNPANPGISTEAIQTIIAGTFFTGAAVTAIETFRGEGVHSPSGFKKFP